MQLWEPLIQSMSEEIRHSDLWQAKVVHRRQYGVDLILFQFNRSAVQTSNYGAEEGERQERQLHGHGVDARLVSGDGLGHGTVDEVAEIIRAVTEHLAVH